MQEQEVSLIELHKGLVRLRGDPAQAPDASVVIPVNAQGDLENVLQLVVDITKYAGHHRLEVILVINNYPPNKPPAEIEAYRGLGINVISLPNVRKPGEAVGFTARIPGIEAAASDNIIAFDADCRIPDAHSLMDWYIARFRDGVRAAYTHVDYYDLKDGQWIRIRIAIHHVARWIKRVVLRIPTIRGSNYAINRPLILRLYREGLLADDMNVGPAVRAAGGRIAYSGSKKLRVLTSGRMFNNSGAKRLVRYFYYRLRYNLRVLPVRHNVALYTHRENDPIRRYEKNQLL